MSTQFILYRLSAIVNLNFAPCKYLVCTLLCALYMFNFMYAFLNSPLLFFDTL